MHFYHFPRFFLIWEGGLHTVIIKLELLPSQVWHICIILLWDHYIKITCKLNMHLWERTKKMHFKMQVLCKEEHSLVCSLQKSKESWSSCRYFGLNHTEKSLFLSQTYLAYPPPIMADKSFSFSFTKIKIANCFAQAQAHQNPCAYI